MIRSAMLFRAVMASMPMRAITFRAKREKLRSIKTPPERSGGVLFA
jgi:hypothetical protein